MKSSTKPPADIGEVLVVPLEDKRFGVAHVIAIDKGKVGIVMSSHVGPKPKTLEDAPMKPYLREPSMSRHGCLDGPPVPSTRWVSSPLPPGYLRLGVRAPGAAEKKLVISAYAGGWQNVASNILIQWLRANDPEGAERLFLKWQRQGARKRREHEKKENARAAALTLEKLAKGTPLALWTKRYPAAIVREARDILRGVARELEELAGKSASRVRTEVLRRGVERFNALDGKNGFQILTTEREDICLAFFDITRAAKMRTRQDPTERWREW